MTFKCLDSEFIASLLLKKMAKNINQLPKISLISFLLTSCNYRY